MRVFCPSLLVVSAPWQDEDMRTREEDAALRNEAMAWLAAMTNDGLDAMHYLDLKDFHFRGVRQPLRNPQQGIYKPKGCEAALSITTVHRNPGLERPYDDSPGWDGRPRYKWRGSDPLQSDNRALRRAMELDVPLIWFWGVGDGWYKPVFPVYLVDEEMELQQFVVATDPSQNLEASGMAGSEVLRRYSLQTTQQRLHQPVFRSMVMRAYETRCAVCNLGHSVLLDAAHIVEDRAENGVAAVRNGLALCKIHHAAYDAGILGVTPEFRVEIRQDILEEIDGPVLEHGLKGLHNAPLRAVPRRKADKPDPGLLEQHYNAFISADGPWRHVDGAWGNGPRG
jgi:putative restriction endonuclease